MTDGITARPVEGFHLASSGDERQIKGMLNHAMTLLRGFTAALKDRFGHPIFMFTRQPKGPGKDWVEVGFGWQWSQPHAADKTIERVLIRSGNMAASVVVTVANDSGQGPD